MHFCHSVHFVLLKPNASQTWAKLEGQSEELVTKGVCSEFIITLLLLLYNIPPQLFVHLFSYC